MTTGAQGPGFNSDLKMTPPLVQEGLKGLFLTYQFLSTFSNFSISVASLFSLSADCFKPICLQRHSA